jgi:hypothetical protein
VDVDADRDAVEGTMSFYECHVVQVICDGPGCYEQADEADSELQAKRFAREAGWVEVDDEWFCSRSCAAKAKRDAVKEARRGR